MNKNVKVIVCLFVLLLSSSPALAAKKLNWLEKLILCCYGDSTQETDNLSVYVKVKDQSGDGATEKDVDEKLDKLIEKATERNLINNGKK